MGARRVAGPPPGDAKKPTELRRRGLPMIIWKDGKVREVPA